ncbi:MAG: hypothetical protein J6D29_03820 [Solobacterium sp.]|nr:hypothetical protein [Solobacterium sp.]
MNLDINYFCTYDEQEKLLNFLLDSNSLTVYSDGIKKNKEDFLVKTFNEELKKTHRRADGHNEYFFSFDKEVEIRTLWTKGDDSISYLLGPSDINCNGIDVKACSYEDNMILFGRISTIFVNDKKIEAFKELKKFMRGKYKKKGRWYISNTILDNPSNYRLIPVAARLQPIEGDLKFY